MANQPRRAHRSRRKPPISRSRCNRWPATSPRRSSRFGILNAGVFTATVLPLSTAYIVCEAFGFEAAVDRKFEEAPVFFTLFAAGLRDRRGDRADSAPPAAQDGSAARKSLQGILLPAELVLMLIVVNRKHVMGEHTNKPWVNAIAWTTVAVVGTLSIVYVAGQFLPGLLGG